MGVGSYVCAACRRELLASPRLAGRGRDVDRSAIAARRVIYSPSTVRSLSSLRSAAAVSNARGDALTRLRDPAHPPRRHLSSVAGTSQPTHRQLSLSTASGTARDPRGILQQRANSNIASAHATDIDQRVRDALSHLSAARDAGTRFNAVGIQQISSSLHRQLFPSPASTAAGSPQRSADGGAPDAAASVSNKGKEGTIGATERRQDALTRLSQAHLLKHNLLGKNADVAAELSTSLPPLQGACLDEHFHKLGLEVSQPYLDLARGFAAIDLPQKPAPGIWQRRAGWTRYNADGTTTPVDAPTEDCMVFDVEVMYKIHPFAVMAVAATKDAWYAWLSPWLLGESDQVEHLIPLTSTAAHASDGFTSPSMSKSEGAKIVVGHNIGYDRARVKEEYALGRSGLGFVDTMSLHVAVNGMCSRQRPAWVKHKKDRAVREKLMAESKATDLGSLLESLHPGESGAYASGGDSDGGRNASEDELWIARSSTNSLAEVAQFHCGTAPDKAPRQHFDATERSHVLERVEELLSYCAEDVAVTHRIYRKVLPNFLQLSPHPVSFAALIYMNSMALPVNANWEKYVRAAEDKYQELSNLVRDRLIAMAEETLAHALPVDASDAESAAWRAKIDADPWLRQLDWTVKPVRKVVNKKTGAERLAKNQKMPGKPQWYRDLFPTDGADINLTTRTRISPLLLRMAWEGRPLVWTDRYGWAFRCATRDQAKVFRDKRFVECDMAREKIEQVRADAESGVVFFKVPHKDGPAARVATPLSKSFVKYFEDGLLSSEFSLAKEALEMNAACSYWISARERISNQMVVWTSEADAEAKQGLILPQAVTMGTITRRAIEATWMTASNAKRNRVGSELKSMIQAPPGYTFVGADVDSEELWIASLMGDAQFGLHGSTALGWMTLEGTKSAGTDLHSKTAKILGISRNDAKVFNYGRIYGAGLKFAVQLLLRFNPGLSEADAKQTAEKLYIATKGDRAKLRPRDLPHLPSFDDSPAAAAAAISANRGSAAESVFDSADDTPPSSGSGARKAYWRGGTESFVFNRLERIAEQPFPRTPVLGAGITQALLSRYLSAGSFLTSRINWAVQSSGVDYLHLLIVAMEYLLRLCGLQHTTRLALTVHDEIRFLCRTQDAELVAWCLQVSNLWTRALFSQQLGIDDLPQSCAFFSEVDIDKVLRKDPKDPCLTPSNGTPILPGESLDMATLLQRPELQSRIDQVMQAAQGSRLLRLAEVWKDAYVPRTPVFASSATASGSAGAGAGAGGTTTTAETSIRHHATAEMEEQQRLQQDLFWLKLQNADVDVIDGPAADKGGSSKRAVRSARSTASTSTSSATSSTTLTSTAKSTLAAAAAAAGAQATAASTAEKRDKAPWVVESDYAKFDSFNHDHDHDHDHSDEGDWDESRAQRAHG